MLELKGTGVSKGIGVGRIYRIDEENVNVPEYSIENPESEVMRYDDAVAEFIAVTDRKAEGLGENEAEILAAHCALAEDTEIKAAITESIIGERINAEAAVQNVFDQFITMFADMEDELLRERALDLKDIKDKVIRILLKMPLKDYSRIPKGSILTAAELTPSITAVLPRGQAAGFLTETGGKTSHTAIIARSLEIPAVTGVKDLMNLAEEDAEVIIDGVSGQVFIEPDTEIREKFEKKHEGQLREKESLNVLIGKETVTKDGAVIELCANIGGISDLEKTVQNDAEGIGLFRSEFLYMEKGQLPTEEEQYNIYKETVEVMGEKPVILRTLDAGGDKEIPYLHLKKEENPFLGFRAVRHSLRHKDIFMVQIRAALRAAIHGDLRIMIPLVTSVQEVRAVKKLIKEAKQELKMEGKEFNEDILVGVMVETPAAALTAENLAEEADFFSIGTNDLVQYTVAVDRGNDQVAQLYSHYHPSVMKLIQMTIKAAKKHDVLVGVCGEAAADPLYIPFLIGAGIDELSVNAAEVLPVREQIRNLDRNVLEDKIKEIENIGTAEEAEEFLKEL